MLQVILQKPDLQVIKATSQKSLRNIKGRSVTLDVLCKDSEGNYYNIEVQKKNNDNYEKRVRYNRSNIDTYVTEKGIKFHEIPNVYVIFISKFDYFKKNKTIYHVDRVLRETQDIVDNGFHEIYVNTVVDDGTDIAALMKLFKSSKVENDRRFPRVCERIRYFKEGKGSGDMCEVIEEYAKEFAIQEVIEALRGLQVDEEVIMKKIMEKYSLSKEQAEKYVSRKEKE